MLMELHRCCLCALTHCRSRPFQRPSPLRSASFLPCFGNLCCSGRSLSRRRSARTIHRSACDIRPRRSLAPCTLTNAPCESEWIQRTDGVLRPFRCPGYLCAVPAGDSAFPRRQAAGTCLWRVDATGSRRNERTETRNRARASHQGDVHTPAWGAAACGIASCHRRRATARRSASALPSGHGMQTCCRCVVARLCASAAYDNVRQRSSSDGRGASVRVHLGAVRRKCRHVTARSRVARALSPAACDAVAEARGGSIMPGLNTCRASAACGCVGSEHSAARDVTCLFNEI